MKYEFNERGKKELYEEFLYSVTNVRKLRKKEKVHIYKMTTFLYMCLVYVLISLGLMSYFYVIDGSILYMFCEGILSVLLLYVIIYMFYIKKTIKKFMSEDDVKTYEFDNTKIVYTDKEKTLKIIWNDINKIVVSKNAILLIPEKNVDVFMAFPIDFLSELEKVLKKFKHEELVRVRPLKKD